jgi:hypothetical protein
MVISDIMAKRLHKSDRIKFEPDDGFFKRHGKRIRWLLSEPMNSEYLLYLRRYSKSGEVSREQVGRRIGRHPAQVGRYEGMGYDRQIPELRVLRKMIVVLQANPLTLLNLQLHFDNKQEALDWIKSCSDSKTKELLDGTQESV